MSIITEQLNDVKVKTLNRATILDGKLFQYYVMIPLNKRDEILATYFDALSSCAYYNDLANNIYHYTTDGDKDFNINIDSTAVLSAQNIVAHDVSTTTLTAVNTTATHVDTTNYTVTSLSSTSLSATTTNLYVNMSSLGQGFSTSMKFVNVVDKINERDADVNDIIDANEDIWSSVSAIKIINDNTTKTLTPKMLKFDKTDVMEFLFTNKCLTVGVSEIHNKATVKNGVLIFTN